MLGDFNHVADKDDRLPRKEPSSRIKKALASLGKTLAITDQWRAENPGTKQYTWTNSHENADGSTSRSRLDRILLDKALQTRATSWKMPGSMGLSDHQIVSVKLLEKDPPFIGEPRWRMNLEDIEDNECMEMARLALLKAQKSMKAGKDPMATWLRAKDEIKTVTSSRQTLRRKERGRHLHALEKDRADLMKRRDFPKNVGLQDRALAIDERISEIKKSKLDRAAEYSAARYASKGESVNKYWFSIGKSIKESSTIRSLRDESGSLKTATEDMAKIATKHHMTHQARQPMTDTRRSAIAKMLTMTDGKRATSAAKTKLSERFTTLQVEGAIKRAATGKAPGADGIPYEFYKHWLAKLKTEDDEGKETPDIRWLLMTVWNATRTTTELDKRYALGLMFLMFKKKDREEIANYRPITLLNTDYKLQTGAMAHDLGAHVQNMLHPDQAGFVPGRDILDHVKLADLVIADCEIEEIDGCLVALDQEKAYDKIDHAYLWDILAAFGLPEQWIRTVKNLYANAETSVLVNQVTPSPFPVKRGVRQGDPLSCLLFDLAIEPLAESLRRSDLKGLKIEGAVQRLLVRLFADDTQLYLSKSDKWTEVKRITDEWCLASTAKFNQEKTEFLPLGSKSYKEAVILRRTLQPFRIRTAELLPTGARLVKDGEPLRILGGFVGTNLNQTAVWDKVTSNIEALATKWSNKRMSMKGRKLISSFIIQSRAQYLMMTNDPPREIIQRVDKATHRVMWAGKKRGLTKMTELYKGYKNGGWGVPSFADRATAARLMWAKKWLAPEATRPLWSGIAGRLIKLTSKKPEKPAKTSTLTQTCQEKKGYRSKLPASLRAMSADARKYGVKVDAQAFSSDTKSQAPVWMSRMADLTALQESRPGMKQLRIYHRVESMRDLRRLTQTNREGCPKHERCMNAVDLITVKTKQKFNIRDTTPVNDPENHTLDLDHTARRKEKNRRDWKNARVFTLDPKVKHTGDIKSAVRIFTTPGTEDLPPATRPPQDTNTSYPVVVYTDGSALNNGKPNAVTGAGIWSDEESLCKAIRVGGTPQTNNRGELFAVTWALEKAPKNRPLTIKTDSTYVVNGLASTHQSWEDRGWLDVQNSDLWRLALQEMRKRTATTQVEKVKAHVGILGNEEADRLAKEGAEKPEPVSLETPEEERWQVSGARLSTLTFKMAYAWVREKAGASQTPTRTRMSLDGIKLVMSELHSIALTDEQIWRSIRAHAVRREVSDFLWAAIHQKTPCGTMFAKWGGDWEQLQFCSCGAVESIRHILTECGDAIWRVRLWNKADDLLRKSGRFPNGLGGTPTLEEILAAGIQITDDKAAMRLYTTVITETAFAIWKVRNRARFDEVTPTTRMAKAIWTSSIEARAKKDLTATRLKGPKTAPERRRDAETVKAWDRVILLSAGKLYWFPCNFG